MILGSTFFSVVAACFSVAAFSLAGLSAPGFLSSAWARDKMTHSVKMNANKTGAHGKPFNILTRPPLPPLPKRGSNVPFRLLTRNKSGWANSFQIGAHSRIVMLSRMTAIRLLTTQSTFESVEVFIETDTELFRKQRTGISRRLRDAA